MKLTKQIVATVIAGLVVCTLLSTVHAQQGSGAASQWDEDEFEGFEQPTEPSTVPPVEHSIPTGREPSAKQGNPFQVFWQQLKNSKTNWYPELGMLAFLVVYIINYYRGRAINENIAIAWAEAYCVPNSVFERNFSLLGPGSGNEELLLKDSQSAFRLYASGRRYCTSAVATLNLRKRQDLLSLAWDLVFPTKDRVDIEVNMSEGHMAPMVMLIATHKLGKEMAKESKDVEVLARKIEVTRDRLAQFPNDNLGVWVEHSSIFYDLMVDDVVQLLFAKGAFAAVAPYLRYLHFTTEHMTDIVPDGQQPKQLLRFSLNLPGVDNMEDISKLLAAVMLFIDVVGMYKLSPEAQKRAAKARQDLLKESMKEKQEQRMEELAKKKQEAKEQEREKARRAGPAALRKYEEKQEKLEIKKAMKMKMTDSKTRMVSDQQAFGTSNGVPTKSQLHEPGHRRLPSDPTAGGSAYSPRNSTDGSSQEPLGNSNALDSIDDDVQVAHGTSKGKRTIFGFRKKSPPSANQRASDTGAPQGDPKGPEGPPARGHHRRWSSLENISMLTGFSTAAPMKHDKQELSVNGTGPQGAAPGPAEEHPSWFKRRSSKNKSDFSAGASSLPSSEPVGIETPFGADTSPSGAPQGALETIQGSPAPNSMSCLGLLPSAPKSRPGSANTRGSTTGEMTTGLLAVDEFTGANVQDAGVNGHDSHRSPDEVDESSVAGSKKGKKPARTLSALLPKISFRRSDSNVELNALQNGDGLSSHSSEQADATETTAEGSMDPQGAPAGSAGARTEPPSPASKAAAEALRSRRCFGRPVVVDDAVDEDNTEEVYNDGGPPPPGVVGLRNLGNTCFVNAAIQCLRFTPGLLEAIAADLSALPAAESQEKGAADGTVTAAETTSESASPAANANGPAVAPSPADTLSPTAPTQSAGFVVTAPMNPESSSVSTELKLANPFYAATERSLSGSGSGDMQANGSNSRANSRQGSMAAVPEDPTQGPSQGPQGPQGPVEAGLVVSPSLHSVAEQGDGSVKSGKSGTESGPRGTLEGAPAAPTGSLARRSGSGTALRRDSLVYAAESESDGENENLCPQHSDLSRVSVSAAQCCTCSPRPSMTLLQQDRQTAGQGDEVEKDATEKDTVGADSAHSGPSATEGPSQGPVPEPGKPGTPMKGAVLSNFRALVQELYNSAHGRAVDPAKVFSSLRAVPGGSDLTDGGQHDCQEVLRVLLDGLHADLTHFAKLAEAKSNVSDDGKAGSINGSESPTSTPPASEKDAAHITPDSPLENTNLLAPGPPSGPLLGPPETELQKSERLWQQYLAHDNSHVTSLFGGQLQSSVLCHKCNTRFTMYEPFWDLSLPLGKEGKGGALNWFASKPPATLTDCLQAFTADELLQGNEAFYCDKCKERCSATKRMRLQRLPKVLVLHIKRFKYKSNTREKLTANVAFPLRALRLYDFLSEEAQMQGLSSQYDLYAVSHHVGNMVGGHYTATCLVPTANGKAQWWTFNDDVVQRIAPGSVVSNSAYMLFYVQRGAFTTPSTPTAAAGK